MTPEQAELIRRRLQVMVGNVCDFSWREYAAGSTIEVELEYPGKTDRVKLTVAVDFNPPEREVER